MTGEFPEQKASNAENVFFLWRHHEMSPSLIIAWWWFLLTKGHWCVALMFYVLVWTSCWKHFLWFEMAWRSYDMIRSDGIGHMCGTVWFYALARILTVLQPTTHLFYIHLAISWIAMSFNYVLNFYEDVRCIYIYNIYIYIYICQQYLSPIVHGVHIILLLYNTHILMKNDSRN